MSEARPEKHDGRRHDTKMASCFLICRVFVLYSYCTLITPLTA